jgi:hypothetical protein
MSKLDEWTFAWLEFRRLIVWCFTGDIEEYHYMGEMVHDDFLTRVRLVARGLINLLGLALRLAISPCIALFDHLKGETGSRAEKRRIRRMERAERIPALPQRRRRLSISAMPAAVCDQKQPRSKLGLGDRTAMELLQLKRPNYLNQDLSPFFKLSPDLRWLIYRDGKATLLLRSQ